MGTASLVFGIILIIVGSVIAYDTFPGISTNESPIFYLLAVLIVTVPMFVIGGLLLRKFDKDRKKN